MMTLVFGHVTAEQIDALYAQEGDCTEMTRLVGEASRQGAAFAKASSKHPIAIAIREF